MTDTQQRVEASPRLGPIPGRLVAARGERTVDQRARLGHRGELSRGDRLNDEIANRGRLSGPREHRHATRAGGEAAQERVLRPTANDANSADTLSCYALELTHHPGIL